MTASAKIFKADFGKPGVKYFKKYDNPEVRRPGLLDWIEITSEAELDRLLEDGKMTVNIIGDFIESTVTLKKEIKQVTYYKKHDSPL